MQASTQPKTFVSPWGRLGQHGRASKALRTVATTFLFRSAVAVVILSMHVWAIAKFGRERYHEEWNRAPLQEPQFYSAEHDMTVSSTWSRLLVSRWDAEHYIALALRGYTPCKEKAALRPDENADDDPRCQLNFFPTYGIIGRYVARIGHFPIDIALFYVSLAASFAFIVMWTSRAMTNALGVGTTYLALLLMNVFSTGFTLVTVQTEALFLALTMAAFCCLARRWLLIGAICAGAATAVRVSGVATGLAYGVALVMLSVVRRDKWPRIVLHTIYALVAGWGILFLTAYYWHRFGDPLIYVHAHSRQYHHEPSVWALLHPDTRNLMQSIWAEPNHGVLLAGGLLWFALGHRRALEGFGPPEQAFWYAIYAGVVGVSMIGSSEHGFEGMSRYLLCALPLFFAIAALTRRRPIVLALWLYMSVAHYWGGSMCFYLGQRNPRVYEVCGFARSFYGQ
jgi:hypothetical protein